MTVVGKEASMKTSCRVLEVQRTIQGMGIDRKSVDCGPIWETVDQDRQGLEAVLSTYRGPCNHKGSFLTHAVAWGGNKPSLVTTLSLSLTEEESSGKLLIIMAERQENVLDLLHIPSSQPFRHPMG
jgi:hypothetical protein